MLRKLLLVFCLLLACACACAESEYDESFAYESGITAVRQGEYWSLLDKDGSVLLERLGYMPLFEEGYAEISYMTGEYEILCDTPEEIRLHGLVNSAGRCTIPCIYQELHYEPTYSVVCAAKDGRWGLLDAEGNILLDFDYDHISDFACGRASVCREDENGVNCYGMIAETGDFVLPIQYGKITIEADGQVLALTASSENSDTHVSYYMNTEGEILLTTNYDSIKAFSGDYAIVGRMISYDIFSRYEYGIINRKGEEILPCIYERISLNPNGMGEVFRNGETSEFFIRDDEVSFYWLNDAHIMEILPQWAAGWAKLIPLKTEPISYLACYPDVYDDGRWIYLDAEGNRIGNRSFSDVWPFQEGFAIVQFDSHYGYIRDTGEYLVEPILRSASDFSEGLAACTDENYNHGYINLEGEWAFKPIWRYTDTFYNGYALVRMGGTDFVEWYHNHETYTVPEEPICWGVIDASGNYAFPLTECDSMDYYANSRAVVICKDDQRCIYKLTEEGPVLRSTQPIQ